MSEIDKAQAAEFDRLATNVRELKADLTEVILEALKDATDYGEEDVMGNYSSRRPKAHNLEVVDGAILVEWSEGGRSEAFVIEVGIA